MVRIYSSGMSSADSSSDSRGSSPSLAPSNSPPLRNHVVQDPRDRVPRPPLRATTSNLNNLRPYMRRNSSIRKICVCLCISIVLFFIAIIAAAAILILLETPPKFSVNYIAVDGLNITSSTSTSTSASASISPAFNVTLVSKNPKNKIGVRYYVEGSTVNLYYSESSSCDGINASRISKTSNNMLVIEMALKCEDAVLPRDDLLELKNEEKSKKLALRLDMKIPMKLAIITWKLVLRVKCDAKLDGLVAHYNISSEICMSNVRLW